MNSEEPCHHKCVDPSEAAPPEGRWAFYTTFWFNYICLVGHNLLNYFSKFCLKVCPMPMGGSHDIFLTPLLCIQHKASQLKQDQCFEGSCACALNNGYHKNRSEHMWWVKFCLVEGPTNFPLPLKSLKRMYITKRQRLCLFCSPLYQYIVNTQHIYIVGPAFIVENEQESGNCQQSSSADNLMLTPAPNYPVNLPCLKPVSRLFAMLNDWKGTEGLTLKGKVGSFHESGTKK